MRTTPAIPAHTKRQSAVIFVLGLGIATVLVGLVYAIVFSATNTAQIEEKQSGAIETIDDNDKALRRVLDCTTPGRMCYERGQAQLAKVVEDINRVVVLASSCASTPYPQTVAEIEACVRERLTE